MRTFTLAIAFSVAGATATALACSYPPPWFVSDGPLGVRIFGPTDDDGIELPRNAAFASGRPQPAVRKGDALFALEMLHAQPTEGRAKLLTVPGGLEPGPGYEFLIGWNISFGPSFSIADYRDDTVPQPPVLTHASLSLRTSDGCMGDSCGDSASIEFTPSAQDDRTPPQHLTFAAYVGRTADDALGVTSIERLSMVESDGQVAFNVPYDWGDDDLFLSVSALDFAGNESARSAPVQVSSAGSGCRIESRMRRRAFETALPSLLVFCFAYGRRRRLRRGRASQ